MSRIHATRARLRLLFKRDDAESRMKREFDFHIAMETDRLVRDDKLGQDEARRRALIAFGGLEKHKEELRSERGFAWMSGLSLDLKLGFRMLVKYPGLTMVGCLALSTAIAACSSYLEVLNDTISPTLSGDFDSRIVRIRNWDVLRNELDPHPLADFKTWRTELKAVEQLGAFTRIERNLVTGIGQAEPVRAVLISASAFRLIPTRPLLGRPLNDADESLTSTDVVVVGERIWRSRLGADSNIVGKTIHLGPTAYTVVGVMPQSFAFPVNYALWIPLKLDAMHVARGQGPMIGVFGRLTPCVTVENAQAEVSAIAARAAREYPRTNANVRPRVSPFLEQLLAGANDSAEAFIFYSINVVFVLFLCVCGANVATLVFARTATREGEMAVRISLGASRARIVAQLFCEAFALTLVSGVVGLVATAALLKRIRIIVEGALGEQAPFWWNDSLSTRTMLYALALSLFAAIVVGVMPALKATGQHLGARLKNAASSNSSMRFGKLWTGVIVSQVALTVVFLLVVASIGWSMKSGRFVRGTFSFSTRNVLTFNVQMDDAPEEEADSLPANLRLLAHYRRSSQALSERLKSQPGVYAMTFASRLPSDEQARATIEVEGLERLANGDSARTSVRAASVATNFFDALNIPVLAGRTFAGGDTISGRNVAIVDKRFVRRVLGERNPIGLRFREVRWVGEQRDQRKFGEWQEIVGVVSELAPIDYESDENGMIYLAKSVEATYPGYLMMRVQGDPHAFASIVRKAAVDVDASMRIYNVVPLDESGESARLIFWSLMRVLAVIGAIALMLSTAGVHALMAFTVARRTREIGIRSALGADRQAIVWDTFSRAFIQVGAGILTGLAPGALIVIIGLPELAAGMGVVNGMAASLAIAAFVVGVAIIGCAIPVWRALRIEPTEALRQPG